MVDPGTPTLLCRCQKPLTVPRVDFARFFNRRERGGVSPRPTDVDEWPRLLNLNFVPNFSLSIVEVD